MDEQQAVKCATNAGWDICDSLLPLFFSRPKLIDYKGQTLREAHCSHAGEGNESTRQKKSERSEVDQEDADGRIHIKQCNSGRTMKKVR